MNKPYVKKYDENGICTNPLVSNGTYKSIGSVVNAYKNRQQRREIIQKKRFKGNKKGVSLSVGQKFKYKRVQQIVNYFLNKDGSKRIIEHYVLSN